MRDLKNKLTSSKNSKNIQNRRGKSFGYQVLGFGAGGGGIVPQFTEATGGTITTSGDYKIHTFTGSGTFSVAAAGNLPDLPGEPGAGPNTVSYVVIAGGGGGQGNGIGGGGGAGGYREGRDITPSYTASPLVAPSGLTIADGGYPITVGCGGLGGVPSPPVTTTAGSNSVFQSITSAGGGARTPSPDSANYAGGSGSGGSHQGAGGAGNTPPVSPPQGNAGGSNGGGPINTFQGASGGGGGAGGGGSPASSGGYGSNAGPGGAGTTTNIPGSPVVYAGGGGGGAWNSPGDPGGAGGPGGGGKGAGFNGPIGVAGTDGLGGGGGGSGKPAGPIDITTGRNGGSGVVIIRYKYQ